MVFPANSILNFSTVDRFCILLKFVLYYLAINIVARMKKKVTQGAFENECLGQIAMNSDDYNNPVDTTNALILPAKTKVS